MGSFSFIPACLYVSWIFAASVGFSQDGNFSLDGSADINSARESQSLDMNSNGDVDLFGDGSVADAPADSKSTIVKPDSIFDSKSAISESANKESSALALPNDATIKTPASQLTPAPGAQSIPANNPVSTPSTATQPVVAPVIAPSTSLSGDVAPSAPLAGDGSMAPVKSNPSRVANDFGGVPPMPGTRRAMAAGEAPEFYNVEEGDTMFDVCSQLIDDGNYWPKLWSLNPDVKNPHFIFPGMKLAFYSGDEENPPFLEVVADDDVVPVEKDGITEAELVSEPVPSHGVEGGSVNVVRGIEEQAPVPVVGPAEIGSEGDPLDGFIFSGRQWASDDLNILVPAFYFAEEKEVLGQIVGGVSGEGMAGDGGKILVASSSSSSLAAGTYTVLRPAGLVNSLRTGDKIGYRYEFEGNVRLTRRTQAGLMQGLVFDGFGGVRTGDIVVNFLATKRSINSASAVGPATTANSSVIGFQDSGKETGGKGDLVFLERQGLSVGSYYVIFRTDSNRSIHHQSNTDAQKDGGPAAIARIIEISGEAALGYIVSGTSEVRVGDSLSLQ